MSERHQPRTLPIRRWLILALLIAFILPVWATGFTAAMFVFGDADDDVTAAKRIRQGAASWTDPAWQATITNELAADDINIVLYENGLEIYRSTPDPLADAVASTSQRDRRPWWNDQGGLVVERIVIPGSDPEQVADIYSPPDTERVNRFWRIPFAAIVTLLLTLTAIGWLVGKTINAPLAATGRAAHQVAEGDLDISLPSSRVREVAEVNRAFESMSHALRTSLDEQAELEQERRLFIGAIAHDLRTPLFALRGYLEGLESGIAETPEQQSRYVRVAREKADALERLITDLFDFSRLEYLEQAPARDPLDLMTLLQNLASDAQPQASTKGVTVVVEASGEKCDLRGDLHLLTRAVENLLDNALRFTPTGGQVRIGCRNTDENVVFSIADTGPGIPHADLPHLFAPLYRGETSRNRRTGGAGLGLTIARRIIVAHGGNLTAANRPEGGAIFTGSLPRC